MSYFDNVRVNDEVYSTIYGTGNVIFVLENDARIRGFCVFQVQYNQEKVFYTEDGVPDWCGTKCVQTIFYKDDLEKPDLDFGTIEKDLLSKKKILEFQSKSKLEMRVPSGAWTNVDSVPAKVFVKALKNKEYYLFRKAK